LIFVLIWICLFFGGSILPPATGIYVASVEPEDRTTATSIGVIMFNILGYFGAPFVSGYYDNNTENTVHILK
jgi:hypothetical protein